MIYSTDFLECWKYYPLKKAKYQAYKAWQKLKADLPEIPVILKSIQNQKKERAFLRRQNRFVPPWKHFSTWLNAGCWSDECEVPTKTVRNTPMNGVDSMAVAFKILTNSGYTKFQEYCKSVSMPPGDIEAVQFKFSGKHNIDSLVGGIG